MQENYELVQKGFRILLPHLAGYIGQEMSRVYKTLWWQEVLTALGDQHDLPTEGSYGELLDSLDIANCLRLIERRWREVFSSKLTKSHRNWASELMGVHNDAAHIGMNDFQQGYAERALDTMALLCEFMNPGGTEEIRSLYRKLRYGSEEASTSAAPAKEATSAGKSKSVAAVLGRHVGENLPSWRDVMQPHPDVAEGRYKSAEFAADLAQVARGEGAYEYRDPVEFFARTYVTKGMAGLLVESIQRLSGTGGEPVIQLKTAFGGGKTHSMLALYHIAHSKISLESVPALKPIMDRVGLEKLPHANVAVLVGTALDPSRRKKPANLPGYSVGTIWGEMAYQLVTSAGRPELYAKYIRDADLKGVAPGSENLTNLFNECGPCLILMDELLAYAELCRTFGIRKRVKVVPGGKTRTESVLRAALEAPPETELLAVQDGARPLVTPELIDTVVSAAQRYHAAAPAVPVTDTIKIARDGIVESTPERSTLFAVQTPQVFDAALLKAAL